MKSFEEYMGLQVNGVIYLKSIAMMHTYVNNGTTSEQDRKFSIEDEYITAIAINVPENEVYVEYDDKKIQVFNLDNMIYYIFDVLRE